MKKFDPKLTKRVFNGIPFEEILAATRNVQMKLKRDSSLGRKKPSGELVTLADIQNQSFILDYFSRSPLAGTYAIKAEEEITEKENARFTTWQLLVDPLDGTNALCRDESTWGVMVGACDRNGVLQYSWNVTSTGEMYTSETENAIPDSFQRVLQKGRPLAIDVYDYGSSASEKFGNVFEKTFSVSADQYIQTSFSSAVWTGWQINQGKSDGLLWLPSEKGKRWYPDYDLIFLGALSKRGYKIRLGKIEGKNSVVVVAPTDQDADRLYDVGLRLMTQEQRDNITLADNPLQITKSL